LGILDIGVSMLKTGLIDSLLILGLLGSILLPYINIMGVGLYPSFFISLLLFFFIKLKFNKYSIILVLMVLMVFLSTITTEIKYGYSFNLNNYIESMKYLQFIPYFLVLNRINFRALQHNLPYWFSFSSIYICLVGLLQVFNPFNLGDVISKFYLGGDSSHLQLSSVQRITLTGSDPNVGGMIASIFLLFNLIYFVEKRKLLYFIVFLLLSYLVLLTQSRTLIFSNFIIVVAYILLMSKLSFSKKILLSILSLSVFVYLFSYLNLDYVKDGISLAISGNNNSANVRLENFQVGFEIFYNNIFFGIGPLKESLSTIIDSEYVLIFQRYGLFGVLVFFTLIFNMLYDSMRNFNSFWGVHLFLVTLLSIFFMITNNVFSGYQIMSIIVLVIINNFLMLREKVC